MSSSVLVVDDDRKMCELIETDLEKRGYEVEWLTRGEEAVELIGQRDFDAIIADLNLDKMSGLDICKFAAENRPDVPVIVITAFGDMRSAIASIRAGAYDFINKPIKLDALSHTLERAIQHRELREEVKRLTEEVRRSKGVGKLIGRSPPMMKVYDLVQRVSETDSSVLLTGESGTGKELVARALHTESDRADMPFIALNCAAVPANLLESELFGHVRGAFTDAKSSRKGLFERANKGTVLLDEIGEMPMEMQPKLLRVLQERKARPVGGSTEIPFDTRILAATNRDLETDVEEGRFREDLYYRLNVVEIHVPPLRARGNDILLLAQHFLQELSERMEKPVKGITSEAARKLLDYDWPGNVRELENAMERAVTLTRFERITVDDLPDRISKHESTRISPVDVDAGQVLTLQELERRYIERVLKAVGDNKTRAAKLLGLDRRTLYRKLERYDKQGS
ncbi:MAG: sigma-54 dependent transcriptional regulator [Myxococcales bacterium]|jgi:two-component system response regulator HydG